jgi:hypothetical protein
VRISIIARTVSCAAWTIASWCRAPAALRRRRRDADGRGRGGFLDDDWVGSKPAVTASVSASGQFGRAQLGPAGLRSRPSNQSCHCGSTLRGSAAKRAWSDCR